MLLDRLLRPDLAVAVVAAAVTAALLFLDARIGLSGATSSSSLDSASFATGFCAKGIFLLVATVAATTTFAAGFFTAAFFCAGAGFLEATVLVVFGAAFSPPALLGFTPVADLVAKAFLLWAATAKVAAAEAAEE